MEILLRYQLHNACMKIQISEGMIDKQKSVFSSSLSLKCALRESGCRIGYEPTNMSRDHFWRSILHCPPKKVNNGKIRVASCMSIGINHEFEKGKQVGGKIETFNLT